MCYAVPLSGAIVTSFVVRKSKNTKIWWLNLMFIGGALFGIIDHLWHGEFFTLSANIGRDLLLGVVISVFILLFWFAILLYCKRQPALTIYLRKVD
jgi:hypothetical protein